MNSPDYWVHSNVLPNNIKTEQDIFLFLFSHCQEISLEVVLSGKVKMVQHYHLVAERTHYISSHSKAMELCSSGFLSCHGTRLGLIVYGETFQLNTLSPSTIAKSPPESVPRLAYEGQHGTEGRTRPGHRCV